jgi:uncharacterized membrane protein
MDLGPVEIIVIGLDDVRRVDELITELVRLRGLEVVRLLDFVLLNKKDDGSIQRLEVDRHGAEAPDDVAAALVGLGDAADQACISVGAGAGAAGTAGVPGSATPQVWAVSDAIPPGTSAAVVLIEHRWAIPLRSAVVRAGGFALEDGWVHPADLTAAGAGFIRPG